MNEVQFDGIVGPTHHYGGLSLGNIASHRHRWKESQPRRAALEGLAKMKRVADLGVPQALLPPQPRPALAVLRQIGFDGNDAAVVEKASSEAPGLLSACYSASAMWTANAATVAPSRDAADGRVHLTPANLVSMFHRSLEAPFTADLLRAIFPGGTRFAHHEPLPPVNTFSDEGAANHTRLCLRHEGQGLHLFVFGFSPLEDESLVSGRFPPRQSAEASRAITRRHRLPPERCLFLRQSREAIDAGAFHNDVVAVGNGDLLLYHEQAFDGGRAAVEGVAQRFEQMTAGPLHCCEIEAGRLSLEESIGTYLFNSQLLSLPGGGMALIAPEECRESDAARRLIEELPERTGGRLREVHFVDLRESMQNGGGPACLRLRVPLTDEEQAAVRGRVFLDDALYVELVAWVRQHYRERLHPSDLADPVLIEESRRAVEALAQILQLPDLMP